MGTWGQLHRRTSRMWPALFAAAAVAVGLVAFVDSDDAERFCTAEGLIGENGQIYGRDPAQGCQFVDENGDVLPGQ